MLSPFIVDRSQYERALKAAADQIGLPFEAMYSQAYPATTPQVCQELYIRGLEANELAACAFALKNPSMMQAGPHGTYAWSPYTIDAFAEFLDARQDWNLEAHDRKEAGETAEAWAVERENRATTLPVDRELVTA